MVDFLEKVKVSLFLVNMVHKVADLTSETDASGGSR